MIWELEHIYIYILPTSLIGGNFIKLELNRKIGTDYTVSFGEWGNSILNTRVCDSRAEIFTKGCGDWSESVFRQNRLEI